MGAGCFEIGPPRYRKRTASRRNNEVGTPSSLRYGSRSRRDPIQEQVASGPLEAYDTGEGRVGTRYRSRSRRDPQKQTIREQVASGPDTGAGRVGTPSIREQVASGPEARSRIGTPSSLRYGRRSRRDPIQEPGRVGTPRSPDSALVYNVIKFV